MIFSFPFIKVSKTLQVIYYKSLTVAKAKSFLTFYGRKRKIDCKSLNFFRAVTLTDFCESIEKPAGTRSNSQQENSSEISFRRFVTLDNERTKFPTLETDIHFCQSFPIEMPTLRF
ncbi:CLUMA_CG003913, isoform A [Clunio marinus]|uniref:CLUMA_CG003913, isoform A n=1 Tax=Clunio marinus TaxID=568069 RepID=A0A1J1HQ78_9DIPT|nr:CLUMA_CG003913, isoform A [Clunio marinus]